MDPVLRSGARRRVSKGVPASFPFAKLRPGFQGRFAAGRPKARAQTQDEVGNRQTGYSFSQSALNLVSNLSPANRGFKAHIKQTVSMEGRRVGISRQGAAD